LYQLHININKVRVSYQIGTIFVIRVASVPKLVETACVRFLQNLVFPVPDGWLSVIHSLSFQLEIGNWQFRMKMLNTFSAGSVLLTRALLRIMTWNEKSDISVVHVNESRNHLAETSIRTQHWYATS
jgi:hypothetical protein